MLEPKKTWCCSPVAKKTFPEYQSDVLRRKLWDLSSHYFCSVIGTCIPSNDLRVLARKSGASGINKSSDYELHRLATTAAADESSRLARLLQNYLEKNSKASVEQLSKLSANELTQYWQDTQSQQDIKASYWAYLTHPMTSDSMSDKAFADIHMRSHLADRQMVDLHKEIDSFKRKLKSTEKTSQTRLTENKQLHKQCKQLRELGRQSVELAAPVAAPDMLRLRTEAEELTAKLNMERLKREELQDELQLLQTNNNLLQDKLAESDRRLNTLKSRPYLNVVPAAEAIDTDEAIEITCSDACDDSDLAGRCIVYVGGRTRQCGRFKNIVKKRNGKFLHHDGGLEDTNRLDSVLAKADAVMCPMDCVSHNAMIKARKYCKSNGTPLIMLDKSSLTAFSSGLEKVMLQ